MPGPAAWRARIRAAGEKKKRSRDQRLRVSTKIELGELEIHPVRRQVVLAGRTIALGARAFDVLLALAERQDRVVSKNELLDLAWPGLVVEENNLTVQISALRKALGSQWITTVAGRGYRLAVDLPAPARAAPEPAPPRLRRRLVALAEASIVGWSKLLARQAAQAVAGWKELRVEILEPSLAEHGGRTEELTPERMRLHFDSTLDAVEWALHVQAALAAQRAAGRAGPMHLRVAIVVDDAVVDDGKLLGVGTLLVEELHALAQHDEVLVSDAVRALITDKIDAVCQPLDAGARGGRLQVQAPWLVKAPEAAAPAGAAVPPGPSMRLPTLAVLPLRNLGPASDAYLATGLGEQVIEFLSLNKRLAVIAHGSTRRFGQDDGGADVAERAAQTFGAQYVLSGTLQRQGLELLIDVTLEHVPSQTSLLRQPFAGSLADVLGFQEQLAADIAAAVDPTLLATETRLALQHPAADASAYDCLLRGLDALHGDGRADAEQAGDFFRRAIELDPGYAQAHAQLAWWHNLRVGEGRLAEVAADREAAIQHALRAVEIDPSDATVLAVAGHVRSFLCRQFTEALALFDQALRINPSCAVAWARSATTLAYLGRGHEALQRVQHALRLSPRDPQTFAFLTTRGTAALVSQRYDEAVAWLSQARRLRPGYMAALRLLVAACVLAGERAEAGELAAELMAADPGFRVGSFGSWYPLQQPHLGIVLEAMRRAGLPH